MMVLKTNKNPASTITGYLNSILGWINWNWLNLYLGFGMNHLPIPSCVAPVVWGPTSDQSAWRYLDAPGTKHGVPKHRERVAKRRRHVVWQVGMTRYKMKSWNESERKRSQWFGWFSRALKGAPQVEKTLLIFTYWKKDSHPPDISFCFSNLRNFNGHFADFGVGGGFRNPEVFQGTRIVKICSSKLDAHINNIT